MAVDARLRGNLYQVIGTFLWASTFPATALLLQTWHPLSAAVARVGGAASVLVLALVLTGRWRRMGAVPWAVVPLGIVGFAGSAGLLVAGQAFADPVTTAVIATAIPLVSLILGLLERTERLTTRLGLGIVLAVAGGIVASLAGREGGLGFRGGEILIMGGNICWAWFSRRAVVALRDMDPIARAALPMASGAAALLALTTFLSLAGVAQPRFATDAQSLALVLWIASFGIAASVFLWLQATALLGVTVASLHVNLGPFYVMLISLGLGGTVLAGQVAGAVLVAAGAVVAQLRPSRRSSPSAPELAARGLRR